MYYKSLEEKIEKCNLCNLKSSVEANVQYGPMYGYGGNSVIICGLAPSYRRASESKYTLTRDHSKGTAGVLFKALDEVKWPTEKTYFTNLIKCSLPENRYPLENEIDTCFKTWFLQEFFLVNPFAIVALGRYTFDYLKNNMFVEVPLFKINHFSYILRNQGEYGNWINVWKEIGHQIKEVKER